MRSIIQRTCGVVGALVLFLGSSPRASAETITLYFEGTTGMPAVSYSLNGVPGSTTPGPYFWDTSPPPSPPQGPVPTFCIELDQFVPNVGEPVTYTVTPIGSSSLSVQADAIASLYGNRAGYSDAAFQLAL